jgi:hypothetical protein
MSPEWRTSMVRRRCDNATEGPSLDGSERLFVDCGQGLSSSHTIGTREIPYPLVL